MTRSAALWGCFLFALGLLGGCGDGGPGKTGPAGPTRQEELTDLAELLREAAANKQKMPAKVADLEPHEPPHPVAVIAMQRGEVVYAWGVGLSAGTGILAYEKGAERAGGWVLLQDGTVKQLSADEFKAAPKAKK